MNIDRFETELLLMIRKRLARESARYLGEIEELPTERFTHVFSATIQGESVEFRFEIALEPGARVLSLRCDRIV